MKKVFSRNLQLRVAAVPITGGFFVSIINFSSIVNEIKNADITSTTFYSFIIGFILSAFIGWPLLALIEWLFWKFRFRYIAGGVACSIGIWMLIYAPINVWLEPNFWLHYAPRRVAIFSCFGLVAGTLYTIVVALINKCVPEDSVRTNSKHRVS